jgi:hypothetical protein
LGYLWVGDNGNSTVTEYTHGVQNTSGTITNGISDPESIAIDGLDDVWVKRRVTSCRSGEFPSFAPHALPTARLRFNAT